MSAKAALYRHFSSEGVLLYVGISKSAVARLSQHVDRSHWAHSIARVQIEWLESRAAALEAEAAAIANEAPLYNVQGVRKVRPQYQDFLATGIRHIGSGKVDGWYVGRDWADHMLGWYQAMFPKDQFEVLEICSEDDPRYGLVMDDNRLWVRDSETWASTAPNFRAADAYDEAYWS